MWFIKKGSSDEEAARRAAEEVGITYDQAALALDSAFREFRRNLNLPGAPEVIIGDLIRVEPCERRILTAVSNANIRRKAELISLEKAQVTIYRLKRIWDRIIKTPRMAPSERNKNSLWWRNIGEDELKDKMSYMESLIPKDFKVPNNAWGLTIGLMSEAQYKNKLRKKYFKKLKQENGELDRKRKNRTASQV